MFAQNLNPLQSLFAAMATDLKLPVSNPPPDVPITTVGLTFSQSLESSKPYERFAKLGLSKNYKYAKPLPDENDYTIVETISQGKFTSVYKALYEKPPMKEDMENFFDLFGQSSSDTGPQLVVLKKIRMNTHEDKEWEELKKELYILKALNTEDEKCRYVVECSGWYHQGDSIFLIFEHVNGCMYGQDLAKFIYFVKEKNGYIQEKSIWVFLQQLCKGLDYLIQNKFFHRDLKPSNILLTKSGNAKLSGFGLSRHYYETRCDTYGFKFSDSLYYRAPEEFYKQHEHTVFSEVWSLGCILYELVTLESPFSYVTDASFNLYSVIKSAKYFKISPGLCTNQLLQQIEHCLQLTPTERPTITAIKEKAHQMNAICGQNEEEVQRYAPTVQEILFGSNFSM